MTSPYAARDLEQAIARAVDRMDAEEVFLMLRRTSDCTHDNARDSTCPDCGQNMMPFKFKLVGDAFFVTYLDPPSAPPGEAEQTTNEPFLSSWPGSEGSGGSAPWQRLLRMARDWITCRGPPRAASSNRQNR